ncbi:MAG: CRISPR-associated endonuclease Cas2 [Succinivibrio sp.]
MQRFLIAYDISKNSIRGRVYRLLKKRALNVQKSLFFFEGSNNDLIKLESRLSTLIENTDSLFVMPCCESCYNRSRIYSKDQAVLIAV